MVDGSALLVVAEKTIPLGSAQYVKRPRETMRIQLIAKPETSITGTSRYVTELYNGLQAVGLDTQLTFPAQVPIPRLMHYGLKRIGVDVETFFSTYPLRANLNGADVYHLTSQMLATLLLFQHFPRPVVVTVLDIIPYLVRQDPKLNTFRHPVDHLFYRLALAGLRRADALIAISEYTKRTLVESLGLSAARIRVVYPSVDRQRFHPMVVPEAFRTKYGLENEYRYILFVGSEDPRKNLSTAMRAFAQVKRQVPHVKLLKVGASQFVKERQRLLDLIAELGFQRDVLFFNYVPDEDLPLFYNVADVCVMPSLYEGFGLPVAEAMSCGTPVVCACVGPLPEVVGDGALQVYPNDANAFADALFNVLSNPDERLRLRRAGQEQAARFTWQRAACETQGLYANLLGQASDGSIP
jgi:glycosyltransferase involved in cell wall biosynthesis